MRRILSLLILAGAPLLANAQSQRAPAVARGTLEKTLTVDGASREYLLHVPRAYDGAKAVPLVIFLHGRGSSGRQALRYYGFKEKADEAGFLVAFPTALGEPRSWQPGYLGRDKRDLAFLGALIDEIAGRYRVDARRVFVCGHSSGGIMSYAAAANLAERIAAIGVVAGTIGFTRGRGEPMQIPKPKQPVSVIAFHAKDDRVVPYEPQRGTGARWNFFVPAPDSVAFWVRHNGCKPEAKTQNVMDGNVAIRTWTNGKGTSVVFYDLEQNGHGWPQSRAGDHPTPSATERMVEFFMKHPKPERLKQRRRV